MMTMHTLHVTLIMSFLKLESVQYILYEVIILYIPANLSLMRSKGCVIKVDNTPPVNPAMRCSYLSPLQKLLLLLLKGCPSCTMEATA